MELIVKILILIKLHPDREWLHEKAYIEAERVIETRNLMAEIPKYQSIDEYFEDVLTPTHENEVVDEQIQESDWEL